MFRLVFLTFLTLAVVPNISADVIVGLPADNAEGNCIPFGCGDLERGAGTGTRYQQVYSASDFSSELDISGVTFFLTQSVPYSGTLGYLDGGTYTVSLSTTSEPVDGLNLSNFDANVGADNTMIFSGSLPASVPFGGSFTLENAGTFLYNPAAGNLLMDIQITGITAPSSFTLLDARNGTAGGIFSRADNLSTGSNDYGLVTQFDATVPGIPAINAIPEPSSIALLGLVLGSFALIHRMRKRS